MVILQKQIYQFPEMEMELIYHFNDFLFSLVAQLKIQQTQP